MVWHPGDLDLGARKVEIGRHNEQGFAFCGKDSFGNGGVPEQWFVKASLLYCLQPKRAGRVRLRIKIDKQNAMAQFRERSAKVHGCSRFADAAFLVSYRDDFHSKLRIVPGLRHLPDDVAARSKRKLNFSNFGFGISAVAF